MQVEPWSHWHLTFAIVARIKIPPFLVPISGLAVLRNAEKQELVLDKNLFISISLAARVSSDYVLMSIWGADENMSKKDLFSHSIFFFGEN